MNLSEIGELIRTRRTMLRLTQEDLSQMSGIGMKTIHQVETGIGNPSFQTLKMLFGVLGLDFSVHIKRTS